MLHVPGSVRGAAGNSRPYRDPRRSVPRLCLLLISLLFASCYLPPSTTWYPHPFNVFFALAALSPVTTLYVAGES